MRAPAGVAPATPSSTAPAGSRENPGEVISPRRAAREFSRLFREHDIAAHPAEVRQLAERFVSDGHTTVQEIEHYVLAYADPTGETAVRNVTRAGGGRDG